MLVLVPYSAPHQYPQVPPTIESKPWTPSFFASCTRGTIFHGLDSERLEHDKKEYKDATYFSKIRLGISMGAQGFLVSLVVNTVANILIETRGKTSGNLLSISYTQLVAVAVIEEIIFRFLIQNAIELIQNTAVHYASDSLKENRAFIWVTSPSCRVLATSAIFAAVHLTNGGTYISVAGAAVQAFTILINSNETVAYEISGDFITPVVCHITNNTIVYGLIKLIAKS